MKNQIKQIALFVVLAAVALALIVTCASAFNHAYAEGSVFRAVCGAVTLVAGGFGVFKASKTVMLPFTTDNNK